MIDHTPGPYDDKTFAEILHDFVVHRGDIAEDYARQQLVSLVEQRLHAADQAGYDRAVAEGRNASAASLLARIEDFAVELETEQTSTPMDSEDGTFPMSAENWDMAVRTIADDLRDHARGTNDVVLTSANRDIEAVITDMETRSERAGDVDLYAARLRAATATVPAAQALRESAYEITAELICCTGDDPSTYDHSICRWAGFARALVLDRAERIENTTGRAWVHTKDATVCTSDFVPPRATLCADHGMEVCLEDARDGQ